MTLHGKAGLPRSGSQGPQRHSLRNREPTLPHSGPLMTTRYQRQSEIKTTQNPLEKHSESEEGRTWKQGPRYLQCTIVHIKWMYHT